MKNLEGYKGKIPATDYWLEECHGKPFEVSFDKRKSFNYQRSFSEADYIEFDNCIGILREGRVETVLHNEKGMLARCGIPDEYL